MRILVLNYEFPPLGGGASPVSYEIAKGLVKLGHSVDVVTMGFRGLPKNEVIDGIEVHRVPCLRAKEEICKTHEMFSYVVSAIWFLRKHLKKHQYDICHCHFIIPTGIVALWAKKRFGLEYVITSHGSDVPGYNTDRFRHQHLFTKPLLKTICSNARHVCAPSIFLQGLIEKNIGCSEVDNIPNGIDLDCFRLDLNKPKRNIILSTGRLLKRKGFQTLIRAVHDVELPFEVHIAGDGPYREHLENLAEGSRTKIVFHGWVEKGSPKLLELYEEASVYVLVSSKENASIALLEGMAAKCVLITSNVSGCPETIGDAGFLIDYDDDHELKVILTKLSEDPRLISEYSDRAYSRLQRHYLWDSIIEEYVGMFENAL
jgi:glycosyltransferase involved in cell wall biosynthesis